MYMCGLGLMKSECEQQLFEYVTEAEHLVVD